MCAHGGAGWTRTTDNAIMSRALYHLSYGTADRELSERLESAPSACASSSGACRWRRAFSYSWPRAQVGWGAWDQDGCGAWIRTKDLRVMSRLAIGASSYAAPQLYSKTNGRRTRCLFRPLQTTSLCASCDHHR